MTIRQPIGHATARNFGTSDLVLLGEASVGISAAIRGTGVTEYSARIASDHSALMPANLITLAHFSVSAAMCLPKSVGGPPNGVAPMSASRACILGSDRAALIAPLRVSITSAGVLLGAQKPPQKLAS